MNLTRGTSKYIQFMIIKTIRIFLAISCYLLSLIALAQSSTTANVAAESLTEKKVKVAVTSDPNTLADKSLAEKSLPHKSDEDLSPPPSVKDSSVDNSPQVGKHVMANMNAGSMILSLLMVLVLIIICAFVLKRFNFAQQGVSQLRLITSLSLGTKERVMVVQVGEQQLLLGVTGGQITLLDKLSEPLTSQLSNTTDLPKNILSFLSAKKS